MRGDLAVRIETKSRNVRSEFGARSFKFVSNMLAHEQPPTDAAHQDGELIASPGSAQTVGGLSRGRGRAGRQTVEIAAHQLRRPAFGNVAGKRHGARFVIYGEDGAGDIVGWPLRIENAQRKQQAGTRQASGFVLTQIKLVEVERRLAVEFEQNVAARSGDLTARAKLVPATGAAVADPDRRTIEADCRDHVFARSAI